MSDRYHRIRAAWEANKRQYNPREYGPVFRMALVPDRVGLVAPPSSVGIPDDMYLEVVECEPHLFRSPGGSQWVHIICEGIFLERLPLTDAWRAVFWPHGPCDPDVPCEVCPGAW